MTQTQDEMITTLLTSTSDLPEVDFIDGLTHSVVYEEMVQQFKNKYYEIRGVIPDIESGSDVDICLHVMSQNVYQALAYLDQAAKMNLLKYSMEGYLDNLGALRGVTRVEASPSICIIRFTLNEAQNFDVEIPSGTGIKTENQEWIWYTDESIKIPSGELYGEVQAICSTVGKQTNDISIGQINTLVNNIAYVSHAENITDTGAGADIQNDDVFRERIYLRPTSYSVAGPEDAYKYWTLSYSAAIDHCIVMTHDHNYTETFRPEPGEVYIYVSLTDESEPTEDFLNGLKDFLDDDTKRPLTDWVHVRALQKEIFDIDFTYYYLENSAYTTEYIPNIVQDAVDQYVEWQTEQLGRDINPQKLISFLLQTDVVKRVEVRKPEYKVVEQIPQAVGEIHMENGGVEVE